MDEQICIIESGYTFFHNHIANSPIRLKLSLLCIVIFVFGLPLIDLIPSGLQHARIFDAFMKDVAASPAHTNSQDKESEGKELEIPAANFCKLLSFTKYEGLWEASIKRSEYLETEKGLLEISATIVQGSNSPAYSQDKSSSESEEKHASPVSPSDSDVLWPSEPPLPDNGYEALLPDNGYETPLPDNGSEPPLPDNGQVESKIEQKYKIWIRVYDGYFRDDGFHEITLEVTESMIGKQLKPSQLLLETVDPLIGFHRYGAGFQVGQENVLFIDKLKFKVKAKAVNLAYSQSGYQFFPDEEIELNKSSIRIEFLLSSEYSLNIVSRHVHESLEAWHIAQFIALLLAQLCLQVYALANIYVNILKGRECASRFSQTSFIAACGLDVVQGVGLLALSLTQRNRFAQFLPLLVLWWGSIILIQMRVLLLLHKNGEKYGPQGEKVPSGAGLRMSKGNRFTLKTYTSFIFLTLLCYWLNTNYLFWVGCFLCLLGPQIVRNYFVGHNLKKNMKYFLCYVLPRYALLTYVRLYRINILKMAPDLFICALCYGLLLFQCAMIWVQTRYGVRSILPRILHPKEFKYFMSQPEASDNICSICLISLNESCHKEPHSDPRMMVEDRELAEDIDQEGHQTPSGRGQEREEQEREEQQREEQQREKQQREEKRELKYEEYERKEEEGEEEGKEEQMRENREKRENRENREKEEDDQMGYLSAPAGERQQLRGLYGHKIIPGQSRKGRQQSNGEGQITREGQNLGPNTHKRYLHISQHEDFQMQPESMPRLMHGSPGAKRMHGGSSSKRKGVLLTLEQEKDIFNNVVLTPCGHKFHIECLMRWMETRLQCPNCRTILPPIEDYQ